LSPSPESAATVARARVAAALDAIRGLPLDVHVVTRRTPSGVEQLDGAPREIRA
jgi:hypothetical protein